jgi:hypothetical protein
VFDVRWRCKKYRRLAERCAQELEQANTPAAKAEWLLAAAKYARLAVQADTRERGKPISN